MADAAAGSVDVRPIHVKLVLLGDAAVGKSSVVLRFASDSFEPNKEPTIGAAFLTRQCPLEGCALRYDIWDTAGQERFHSLAPMYYRNAQAAVVVYDVTKAASLDKAKSWVKELQLQANPLVIALVGNKVDLVQSSPSSSDSTPPPEGELEGEQDAVPTTPHTSGEAHSLRQVPTDEAQAYAKEAGLLFFETSAKTGVGISEMFTEIAKNIPIERILASTSSGSGRVGAATRSAGRIAGPGQEVNLADQQSKKDACSC